MKSINVSSANIKRGLWSQFFTQVNGASGILSFPSKYGVTEKAKLLWVIKLRWVAILLFFFLAGPALVLGSLDRYTALFYVGVLAVLLLFNLFSQLLVADFKNKISEVVICFHLAFDLLILTGLLALTGGAANPFIFLFALNASIGGLLIAGRLSWPFIFMVHAFMAVLQVQAILSHSVFISLATWATFVVNHFIVLSSWMVMRSLGSFLERQNERQNQSKIAIEKQDRLRSVGALAAGFSHEFASPLNVAKIRLERLMRQQKSEDVEEALLAIKNCESVIQQMNSSQLDARSYQFKKIMVGELLVDIIESWKEENREARIETSIEGSIESIIPPINFSQVVMNLIDNAYESRAENLIQVVLSAVGNQICLSVTDDGPGFSENVLRQRGEPFVTTKKNGTGLGLYVSELFAQSLGGHLLVKNLNPRGAVVTLCWPKQGEQE